ncbi:MAG TPA: exosortase/archaeosortase family protein [Chthoniobacterales bacterium]|nr:exosortase/archaeosortase family protein [Chthoniobacterales bacterium]
MATPHKFTETAPLSRERFPVVFALSVLFLAALWFGLCRELSGEWSVNEQYNFGWFVPFFALYLFWLRWQDRPPAQISSRMQRRRSDGQAFQSHVAYSAALAMAIAALLLLLPLRLFEVANPEWRLLACIHALAVVTLTLLLLWWAGGKAWFRHFAFPVVFILIAVPWPTAMETPVIQGLMRVVAHVAAETAMLLGTPAQVEGNLIRVTNGLVGVNEACSGIRSLQTSLMIGLLLGEVKRLSVLRRAALVVCAVVIALLANFLRAVFLVRIAATENLSEVSRWHDIAGYSIIALVFAATLVLTYLLGKSQAIDRMSEIRIQNRQLAIGNWQSAIPVSFLIMALCWLLFVEIGTAAWYRLHERDLVSGIHWNVQWPEQAPNFRKLKIDNEIRAVLRFDEGDAAGWTISSPVNATEPNIVPCSLYVFRWNPGKNSALLANLHRPDVCLPASGWTQVADDGVRNYPVTGVFELPFRHFEFQRAFENSAPQTAHAFYCLSEDRAVASSAPLPTSLPSMIGSRSEWTRAERIRTVLEGRRHLGQQVIQAIFISSYPFSAADAESQLRDLVREVVVLREPEK